MKRVVLACLAVAASLVVAVSPVLAADTYHWRSSGNGFMAVWSDVPGGLEQIPPGTYFETSVSASTSMSDMSTADTMGNGLCVNHWTFTVDGDGNWVDESGFGACGDAAVFQIDKKLGSAHVTGSVAVQDCTAWDDETGECIGDWITLGMFAVDVTMTGTGPLYRQHGASSGGTAGFYQYTSHGNGSERAGIPSGSITLDGASVIDDATMSGGNLWSYKDGGVDIMICNKRTGC